MTIIRDYALSFSIVMDPNYDVNIIYLINSNSGHQIKCIHHWVCTIFLNSLQYFEEILYYTYFAADLYHEWVLSIVKCFFHIYWDDDGVVFIFHYLGKGIHCHHFYSTQYGKSWPQQFGKETRKVCKWKRKTSNCFYL